MVRALHMTKSGTFIGRRNGLQGSHYSGLSAVVSQIVTHLN